MATAILGILATLIPFSIWLIKRRIAESDNPETIKTHELARADQAIAQGPKGIDDVNLQIEDAINDSMGHDDHATRATDGVPKSPGSGGNP